MTVPLRHAPDRFGRMNSRRARDLAAPEELGIFVGLKSVPPTDPFPKAHWNKRACAIIGSNKGPADKYDPKNFVRVDQNIKCDSVRSAVDQGSG
jgi:hypothetical protein